MHIRPSKPDALFSFSVASVITLPLYSFASSDPQTLQGDPFDTSVLLWTRAEAISPAGSNALPDQSVPVCVSYKISTSSDLSGEVDSGSAFTSYDVDWTLKVEATGLKPDTKYFYGFADCTNPTTTSPIGTTRTLASPNTPAQEVNGGKPLSIAVFSCSQFQAGWFNAYGYAAHNTTADIFIHLGDYVREISHSVCEVEKENVDLVARQGLSDTLSESKKREAVWRVVGQQIVFTQLSFNGTFDVDAWDGYRANRARILDHLYQNEISNTVILSGDSHANWVSDLAHPNDTSYDPVTGEGAIGVEFAGTAVTSSSAFGSNISPTDADLISSFLVETNTELQWSEGFFRGFFLLSIDSETLNATFYGMENITFANLDAFPTAQFVVKNGQNRLSRPVADDNVKAGALKSSVMKV
ncbi:Alkaline phosphatase D [Termitomyces sp. T112]|nr:Alkaline phosphatase D [Termitomyces sp. T112]